jgi:hypothetical protein
MIRKITKMDSDTLLEFEANKKSEAVAIVLSLFLFAGSGTWYAGNASRGKKIVLIALALLIVTAGIGYVIIAIWSALDANKIAKLHNLTLLKRLKEEAEAKKDSTE